MKRKKVISKDDVNKLELFRYEGQVDLVDTPAHVPAACNQILQEPIVGIDTETRPAFRKGQRYQPSLLQVATSEKVFLFRINMTGFSAHLRQIFESPDTVKVGVAIDDDIEELKELKPFEEAAVIELNNHFRDRGFASLGLRKLAALVLKIRVSKSQQTSNWEADTLKPRQIRYAATDAWICRELYLKSLDTDSKPSPN